MKVVIIGSGNVATVMGGRATGAGHRIVQVVARREEAAARLAAEWNCAYTTQWGKTDAEADIYIVSVSDRALEGLELRLPGRLVVHTAGAVAGSVLRSVTERWGVLYPLQSLRSEIRPYPEFPLLITAGRGRTFPLSGISPVRSARGCRRRMTRRG
ncbi:NAD(P)-binding domain-containing protein [Puia sp. P3]|uniref:NAD(P)-binding domain-containing protein n=1 Tax=Puia sp. P3 TaxID=3423952 RepID=UPI003D66A2A2